MALAKETSGAVPERGWSSMPGRFAAIVILIVGTVSGSCLFASDLKPQSRMEIMRGLIAEYATAKSPLPRGEKGLRLKADGAIEQESLRR